MPKSLTAEVEFLRDQVQRLEATLAQYQQKYKPLKATGERLPFSDAPWEKFEVLSPLLLEYDDSIDECIESKEKLKSNFTTMKNEMERIVKENDELRKNMKEVLEKAVNVSEKLVEGTVEDVTDLKHRLEMVLKEKEQLSDVCQSALSDVEKLELELVKLKTNPQWRQTAEVKDQYNQMIEEMLRQVNMLQDELRRSKSEQRTAEVQVVDLRRTLDELREQLLLQKKAHQDALAVGILAQEESELAKHTVSDQESKIFSLGTEVEKLQTENGSLNDTCKELQMKCVDLEQKEYEASLQVRDSVQLVENVVLERDQARIHEQQLLDENRKLQDAISKLLDEAGSRTKEEVDNIKSLCNVNLERLTEDLYQLEMDLAEKTTQMDRMQRDKKILESELEMCYKEGLSRGTKDQFNLTELTRRACLAEAERDDATIKLENLQNQMKRFEIGRAQEKLHLTTECTHLKERVEKMSAELDQISRERLETQSQLDEVKRQLIKVQNDKDVAERKFARDLVALQQDQSLKEREYDVRLQTQEDSHRRSLADARRHFSAQQKAAAKWKVECEMNTQQFEQKVAELRSESTRMKQKNIELIHLLAESQKKTVEAKRVVSEYTRNVRKMEDQIREAEQRTRLEHPRSNRSSGRRRPYSPGSDSPGHGSPFPMYGTDDFINGISGSR